MAEQVLHRLLEQSHVDGLLQLKHQRLIPVMWLGDVLLEEPVLHWCQRQRPCDDSLFSFKSARHSCQQQRLVEQLFDFEKAVSAAAGCLFDLRGR